MRRLLALGGLTIVVAAVAVVPLPWVVMAPGPALSVPSRVELGGHSEDAVTGDLLLTTVQLREATPLDVVAGWLDDDRTILPREQVIPPGVDDHEYDTTQRALFAETAQLAAAVGLQAAGLQAEVTGGGAVVAGAIDGGPADGRLSAGDLIVGVNGRPVRTAADLTAITARASAGEKVTLDTRRGDQTRQVDVVLDKVSHINRPGLGVAVRTAAAEVRLPFDVEVDQGSIGGPSAGLMIALAVYDLAHPDDLTRGRRIAGTGTIDARGKVGPVGGVAQKVAAAGDAGASIFLVPPDELQEAAAAAPRGVRVIAVTTFEDALRALAL